MEDRKMDEVIKNICQALKEEADAVISYTDKIYSTNLTEEAADTSQVLEKIRLDEVEHIQNLTLELTKLMTGGALQPVESAEKSME